MTKSQSKTIARFARMGYQAIDHAPLVQIGSLHIEVVTMMRRLPPAGYLAVAVRPSGDYVRVTK